MKLHSRVMYLVVFPVLVIGCFAVHSYYSFHAVDYSEIQRIINRNNDRHTQIPSSKPVIRLQSWNLKYDKFKDNITVAESIAEMSQEVPNERSITTYANYEETSWSIRRFAVVNDILFNDPDIFCVQETLKHQLDDLDEMLMYRWKWLGVARDDGATDGEHTAIFIKRTVFDILATKTLWLSETPYEISKYPGANSNRIVTIARLQHKLSGDKFSVINTHLDSLSEDAKRVGANMLKYIGAHEYGIYGYVLMAGDMNSGRYGKKSTTAVQRLTGEDGDKVELLPDAQFNEEFYSNYVSSFKFMDLLEATPPQNRMGHLGTATGFRKHSYAGNVDRIDFLMGGVVGDEHNDVTKRKFEVIRFKTGENFYDYGVQISDHRPVIADIVFY